MQSSAAHAYRIQCMLDNNTRVILTCLLGNVSYVLSQLPTVLPVYRRSLTINSTLTVHDRRSTRETFYWQTTLHCFVGKKRQQCPLVCSRKLRETVKRSLSTAVQCPTKQTVKRHSTAQWRMQTRYKVHSHPPISMIEVNFQNDRI
jgi:hypothetical protein